MKRPKLGDAVVCMGGSRDVSQPMNTSATMGYQAGIALAAEVTFVHDNRNVSLLVKPPGSTTLFATRSVPYDDKGGNGTWHWYGDLPSELHFTCEMCADEQLIKDKDADRTICKGCAKKIEKGIASFGKEPMKVSVGDAVGGGGPGVSVEVKSDVHPGQPAADGAGGATEAPAD